jgi:hypothetical protein
MPSILSGEAGISVRNGFFCTHPYCERLLGLSEEDMNRFFEDEEAVLPGMVRISFGFYNNHSEIDKFLRLLRRIAENKEYFINKYSSDRSTQKTGMEGRRCPDSHIRGC